ncbi:MAG: TRAP transporter large permease subunit, partial [candidate division WOR-3 bacterium]
MSVPVLVMVGTFLILLAMNVPIGVCIGLATLWAVMAVGGVSAMDIVAPRLATGIDSFALLAIPFFILMGLAVLFICSISETKSTTAAAVIA